VGALGDLGHHVDHLVTDLRADRHVDLAGLPDDPHPLHRHDLPVDDLDDRPLLGEDDLDDVGTEVPPPVGRRVAVVQRAPAGSRAPGAVSAR
jgi:hypothetical protein